MRIRQARLTAFSAFAALALGAAAMAFERASPSVLAASPPEFASWARAHHRELLTQSVIFALSTAPLLVFFAGLRVCLRRPGPRVEGSRVDLSLLVLGAGAVWVSLNLLGQAVQATMAVAARSGASAAYVASLGDLMRVVLAFGNVALATASGATAFLVLQAGVLPRWLGWLSALTAAAHLVSVLGVGVEEGPFAGDGVLGYLPYPLFVAWLVGVAVALLRSVAVPTWAPSNPTGTPANRRLRSARTAATRALGSGRPPWLR